MYGLISKHNNNNNLYGLGKCNMCTLQTFISFSLESKIYNELEEIKYLFIIFFKLNTSLLEYYY